MLERSHASTKQALKIETGERRSLWQKYVSIAVLNCNTSYHTSIGCEPSRVFLERILYNVLDLILGFRPQQKPNPTSQIALDTLYQTELIYRDVRQNAKQAYVKFKAFFDKKANASKFEKADYVHVLQPKADHQWTKILFTEFRWVGPYIIEKCYQTIIISYANLAPARFKCFIACTYDSSHPENFSWCATYNEGMESWSRSVN